MGSVIFYSNVLLSLRGCYTLHISTCTFSIVIQRKLPVSQNPWLHTAELLFNCIFLLRCSDSFAINVEGKWKVVRTGGGAKWFIYLFQIIFILGFIKDYISIYFLINIWANYCRMWSNSNNFHYTIHWYKLIAWKKSVFPVISATAHDVQCPTSYITSYPSAHLLPFTKQH